MYASGSLHWAPMDLGEAIHAARCGGSLRLIGIKSCSQPCTQLRKAMARLARWWLRRSRGMESSGIRLLRGSGERVLSRDPHPGLLSQIGKVRVVWPEVQVEIRKGKALFSIENDRFRASSLGGMGARFQ